MSEVRIPPRLYVPRHPRKETQALRIKYVIAVRNADKLSETCIVTEQHAELHVYTSLAWSQKHMPKPGDYLVEVEGKEWIVVPAPIYEALHHV